MLEIDELRVHYGQAPALWGVSLQVHDGELVCVVGPNGAGKSTLINVIAGLHRATSGTVRFDGQAMQQLPAHRYCAQGIAIVPEGRRLLTGMTVLENLELGSYLPGPRAQRAQSLEQVLALFPALRQKLPAAAGSLSGGQQQMVAIGRALMSRPRLLLLDEPSLGLAPAVVLDMFAAILAINQSGTAVLLVEQNVAMAMELARRAYVMEEGRIVAQGEAAQLLERPEIQRAYLGVEG